MSGENLFRQQFMPHIEEQKAIPAACAAANQGALS
jgi:hypothetical protein